MKSILSIDGGGIRGILPLKVLEYIEEHTGKQIHELFHVIGGTSTGGIIALGLNSKIPGNETIYKAQELLKFYTTQEDVKRIFKHKGIWQPGNEEDIDKDSTTEETRKADELLGRPGRIEPFYESHSIEKFLQEKFGSDTKMSELQPKPDVSVFSYDIQNDGPYYFNSKKASKNPQDDYYVWQAARATSAAPTFFPAAKFSSEPNLSLFVDGGVYINNPALALLIQAKDLYPDEQNFLLVSLGTGNLKVSRPQLENAGAYGWLLNITHPGALLEVMMNGVSEATHHQLQELVSGNLNSGLKIPSLNRYERYQQEMQENIAMDDIKPKTLTKLVNLGVALVNEKKNELNELCEVLAKIK
ncbi:patatin-like phospholipase family protein [Microcoleus sp. T2B6]|uniref:patatin-like phospholipase family protein n=1 Tax=Microcoleus sp. T2B6 TaxID=3055424 RepID=UPI002FD24796